MQVFIRADGGLQQDMGRWRGALSQLADAEPSTCAIFLVAAASIPPKPYPALRMCLTSRISSPELHTFLRMTLNDMLRGAVRRGGGLVTAQHLVRTQPRRYSQSGVAKPSLSLIWIIAFGPSPPVSPAYTAAWVQLTSICGR